MAYNSAIRSTLEKRQTQRDATTGSQVTTADAAKQFSALHGGAEPFVPSKQGSSSRHSTVRTSMPVSKKSELERMMAYEGPVMSYSSQTLPVNLGCTKAYWNPPQEDLTPGRTARRLRFKARSPQFTEPDPEQGQEWRTYHSKLTKPTRQNSEQLQVDQNIIGKRKDRNSDASETKAFDERRDSHQEEDARKNFLSASRPESIRPSDSASGDNGTGDSSKTTSIHKMATEAALISDDSTLTEPKLDESMDRPKAQITGPDSKNSHIDELQVTDGVAVNSTANTSGLDDPCSMDDLSHNTPPALNRTILETSSAVGESVAVASNSANEYKNSYERVPASIHSASTSSFEPPTNRSDDESSASSDAYTRKVPAHPAPERSHQQSESTKDRPHPPTGAESRDICRAAAPHIANPERLGQDRQTSIQQTAAESMCILTDSGSKLIRALADLQQDWITAGCAIISSEDPLLDKIKSTVAMLRIRTQDVEVATQRLDRTLNHLACSRESEEPPLGLEDLDASENKSDGFSSGHRVQKARNRRGRISQVSSDVGQQQISSQARQASILSSLDRTTRNSAETSVPCELQFGKRSKKPKWDDTVRMRAGSLLDDA